MKQFVFLLLIIVAIMVGTTVALKWHNGQDQGNSGDSRDLDAASARQMLKTTAGVTLPASAAEILGRENTLVGHWIAVRFDMPAAESDAWLASEEKLGKAVQGNAAKELHEQMGGCSTWVNSPWWNLGDVATPVCAESQGTRTSAGVNGKWYLRTCLADLPGDKKQVYILYSDDLTAAAPATLPAAK